MSNIITPVQIAAASALALAFAFFAARWIYFTRPWKKLCPKCRHGLMERKSFPVHGGRGPVEKMWSCPGCGHRTFMIVDV